MKGLDYETRPIDLRRGDQRGAGFLRLNPEGLVPFYIDDRISLGQSLAIIEYLDETHPEPILLPRGPIHRARVRAAAQLIACDIHPLNNLRVLRHLQNGLGHSPDVIGDWGRRWIEEGFRALELLAEGARFLLGDEPTLADLCLVPQMYNARRIGIDLTPFPNLSAVDETLRALDAVRQAHPDSQLDADAP
jgi:maleylacetoacetate isomerase